MFTGFHDCPKHCSPDEDYLCNQQKKYDELCETHRQETNEYYSEFCRQMILAATVLIGLSCTIATASNFVARMSSVPRSLLVIAWIALLISLALGITYLWVSAKYVRSYMVAYSSVALHCRYVETREQFEQAYASLTHDLKNEAGTGLLRLQAIVFVVAAGALTISLIVTLL